MNEQNDMQIILYFKDGSKCTLNDLFSKPHESREALAEIAKQTAEGFQATFKSNAIIVFPDGETRIGSDIERIEICDNYGAVIEAVVNEVQYQSDAKLILYFRDEQAATIHLITGQMPLPNIGNGLIASYQAPDSTLSLIVDAETTIERLAADLESFTLMRGGETYSYDFDFDVTGGDE